MEDAYCSVSLSSLLCLEDESRLNDEEEEQKYSSFTDLGLSETEDEYIEMLVSRETSYASKSSGCFDDWSKENWLKRARLDAVRWILKTRAFFGFGFQTAYLSMTYLDRFLSRRTIHSDKYWAVPLLSVACLSLAAKMEECRIPPLSEFRVEDYNFECKVIRRMEIMVLNTLEWRMNSVTPFAYLNYFVAKFSDLSRPKALISRAVELILGTSEVMNLMHHRPSTIAAAAVLVVFDHRLTKKSVDFKLGSISSGGYLENEHVFSCYNLMRELENGKLAIPKIVIHPNLSSIYDSSVGALDSASCTSHGSKRRRTGSNDCSRVRCVSSEKGNVK